MWMNVGRKLSFSSDSHHTPGNHFHKKCIRRISNAFLSHKERTAIRNSKRSWLITTAFMHTWWSRQEWNQCTNYPFLILGKHTVSILPQVPAPESSHGISPLAYNCITRVWTVVDHVCSKWTTIISPIYCMRSYASINRRRPIGHDASRGNCNTNTTLVPAKRCTLVISGIRKM